MSSSEWLVLNLRLCSKVAFVSEMFLNLVIHHSFSLRDKRVSVGEGVGKGANVGKSGGVSVPFSLATITRDIRSVSSGLLNGPLHGEVLCHAQYPLWNKESLSSLVIFLLKPFPLELFPLDTVASLDLNIPVFSGYSFLPAP